MRFRVSLRGIGAVIGLFVTLALAGCGAGGSSLLAGGGTTGGGSTGGSGGGSTGGGGTGGGSGSGGSTGGGTTPADAALSGTLYGGQQPISGSTVTMYAAGTTGYGTGATSILSGSGHVMTDANGGFSLASGYSCPSPTSQVYLVASGGNTGSGVNNKAVLMAALGNCNSLTSSTFISMNEVSSVAAVYALAQFMTPGSTAVGTSSTNITGMVNAFHTVTNLTDLAKGTARSTTPAGNGTVPASTINTLANIMAACVNTTGATPTCTSLFSAATPSGGTAPTDTLAAILDIAQNPGHSVTALFNVPPAQALFQPSLSGAPNDWTISVEYTGGGLSTPGLPAIDAAGNIWVPNGIDPGTLSEFSSTGEPLSGANGFSGGGLSLPFAVAVDLNGNVWSANFGVPAVSEHTAGGTALSGNGFTATGLSTQYGIALDATGNVFTANSNSTVTKLNAAGTSIGQFTSGGLNFGYALAVDELQNVWVANAGPLLTPGNTISKFSNSGTAASLSGFLGGGLNNPEAIAIDANGNVWAGNFSSPAVSKFNSAGAPQSGAGYTTPAPVAGIAVDGSNTVWTANLDGSVSHLSNAGTAISPATGFLATGATGEVGVAIDASGNVWTTDAWPNGTGQYSLYEYVGAAGPTAVPLQQAVKGKLLGQRP
ncbi:MAG TPA: NHL repeat-containing protein [Edaphobacter sp.]|nr:NHL repeat-containing protein [Edaphobacter sp.]